MKLSEFSEDEIRSGHAARMLEMDRLYDAQNTARTPAELRRIRAEIKRLASILHSL